MRPALPRLFASAAIVATAFAFCERRVRPWHERWGATDDDLAAVLPGDDAVAEPASQVTRVVAIDAPASAVWPWLVQMGADRGGFYSYDWLEDAFGLGIHSADRVVDAWQDLAVGDLVYADRGRSGGWVVVELRPEDTLVLQLADVAAARPIRRDEQLHWEFSWTFVLRPTATGCRLLIRERTAFTSSITRAVLAPVGPVSFVMTRKMLLGIKARAEAGQRSAPRT